MANKHCFDSKCLELAEHFYPHATREWLANLAQQFQDAAENAEDIDDKTLPIPDFLRNPENLRAERAAQETPADLVGALQDRVHEDAGPFRAGRSVKETPAEPPRPGCEEWWHLKQYGYAPGGYIITCFDCKETVWDCDKRASICRPCAEKRHAAKTSPAPAERTVWTKSTDSDPYCVHCGKTWDMHICDGRSSCPTSNR
jgi:hypothetical protein